MAEGRVEKREVLSFALRRRTLILVSFNRIDLAVKAQALAFPSFEIKCLTSSFESIGGIIPRIYRVQLSIFREICVHAAIQIENFR